ncbi:hypothetical protein KC853_02430, partial [Candidatus Saccharibacteria bacterium]|nr:hypothetical protein [Candidatus Saccharibacteria bacterium]
RDDRVGQVWEDDKRKSKNLSTKILSKKKTAWGGLRGFVFAFCLPSLLSGLPKVAYWSQPLAVCLCFGSTNVLSTAFILC